MRNCTLSIIVLGVILAGCGGSGAGSVTSPANANGTGVVTPNSHGADDTHIEDAARVVGPSSTINATAKTFQVTAKSGTFALNSLVKVSTTSTTRYRDAFGNNVSVTTFFSLLPGKRVEVEGAASGSNLTATKAKIEKS